MTFFLSKFLPTLFFPLGTACLFIAVSLIAQVRKRSRMGIAANLAALAVLCLTGNRAVSHLLLRPLEPGTSRQDLSLRPMPFWYWEALQHLPFRRSPPFIYGTAPTG
jgi:hypothetical protein